MNARTTRLNVLHDKSWTKWRPFPDPREQGFLYAPFGFGVYQLYDKNKRVYVLFGTGQNVAIRMCSLLPEPFGRGRRNNSDKREYVLQRLKDIQYRTIAFSSKADMLNFEKQLKSLCIHMFNS